MDEYTFLQGAAIKNFRAFGDRFYKIHPFRKINFFIGENNSGKSTALIAIRNFLYPLYTSFRAQMPQVAVDNLDKPLGNDAIPSFGVGIPAASLVEALDSTAPQYQILKHTIQKLQQDSFLWIVADMRGNGRPEVLCDDFSVLYSDGFNRRSFSDLSLALIGNAGDERNNFANISKYLIGLASGLHRKVHFIPAIRSVKYDALAFSEDDLSGKGIIKMLAALQNPNDVRAFDHEIGKFDAINNFLRYVTGESDAQIIVPSDQDNILVAMNGRKLPLANLGTGIEQTLMLATYCTNFEDSIICIEEPELHLHPALQKKLIRFLSNNTNNQYFIATHSASFIDTEGASVFHVRLNAGEADIAQATLDKERYSICHELGYRASDIIQSNFVIWVEGPSERIYLEHWIRHIDPRLEENVHYSVVFYGGRLLSHLSADDDEIEGFIKLRALNRNVAIIMDSDRSKAGEQINSTKKRVRQEIEGHGGFVWVTKGREIENYLPHELMQKVLRAVHPRLFGEALPPDDYAHAFYFNRSRPDKEGNLIYTDADKVQIAKRIAEFEADLSRLDLRQQVKELVGLIQAANDLSE